MKSTSLYCSKRLIGSRTFYFVDAALKIKQIPEQQLVSILYYINISTSLLYTLPYKYIYIILSNIKY